MRKHVVDILQRSQLSSPAKYSTMNDSLKMKRSSSLQMTECRTLIYEIPLYLWLFASLMWLIFLLSNDPYNAVVQVSVYHIIIELEYE